MVCSNPRSLYTQENQGHLPCLQIRQTKQNAFQQLHRRQTPNRPHRQDQPRSNHRRVLRAAIQTQD